MAILEMLVSSLVGSYGLAYFGQLEGLALSKSLQYIIGFVSLLLIEIFFYGIYDLIIYPVWLSPLIGLPEPKAPSIWYGHGTEILAKEIGDPHLGWVKVTEHQGLLRYLGIFNRERLLPVGPKVLAEVLTTKSYHFVKPRIFQFAIGKLLGNGLLMAEGDEHKRQRKIIMPAFHPRHLRSLFPLFAEKSREMVNIITDIIEKSEDKNPIVDYNSFASRCTLDIIGNAGAGIEFNSLADASSPLFVIYRNIFTPGQQWVGILNMIMPQWFMQRLPAKTVRDIATARSAIMKICEDIIAQKRQQLKEKKELHPDILSIMIAEGTLTDEEMKNQLMTFMAAGHETTASAVSMSVYELARRPEVAAKLRAAVREAIPSFETEVPLETIENIRYLRNFCNEILRYCPPVPLTVREVAHDTTIDGHFIPKDATIMLLPSVINRMEDFWGPDAAEFNPDRWDKPGGNGGATSNYGNMTFLMGPRSCIGQKFAVEEFKTIMAYLIGRFEFEEKEKDMKISMKAGITQRPSHDGPGLPIKTKIVPGW